MTVLLAGGLGVIVIATLGTWLLSGTSSGDALGSLPEADLVYAGSERLSEGSRDRVDDVLGTTNAAWWKILGTDATLEDLHSFYEGELIARGWESVGMQRSTSEIQAHLWRRAGLRFRLGFLETEEWHQRLAGSDRFPTLYEIRLIEREPGD